MIAIESKMNFEQNSFFWSLGTVRAVKIGFAGCLSTVSTFINEFSTFLTSQKPVHGYIYACLTIFSCASTAALAYFIISKYDSEDGNYGYY